MGAAIEKVGGFSEALSPRSFDEVMRFAELVAKSDLVPPAYKNKPGNVLVAVQMGAEIGLAPLQAVQNIAVINGKPAVWGDALLALVQGHPECEDVIETPATPDNGMTATCVVKRRGRSVVTQTFSQAEATKAQLWGKQGPWQQYPKRMLQMRARAFALRDSFADVLRGIGMAEEVQDIPVRGKPPTVTVQQQDERPTAPPPALTSDASTPAIIDAPVEEDPADFVLQTGKNAGKRLGDLDDRQISWYSEECRNAEIRDKATAVREARYRKRELDALAAADAAEKDINKDWGMGTGDEAEAEAMASAHD